MISQDWNRSHRNGALMPGDYPVPDSIVLPLRNYPALHQIIRVAKRSLRDDAIRVTFRDPRKAEQILPRRPIDVDGPVLVTHALLHSIHHGLSIAPHSFGGFGRSSTNFVGIVSMVRATDKYGEQQNRYHQAGSDRSHACSDALPKPVVGHELSPSFVEWIFSAAFISDGIQVRAPGLAF